MNKRTEKTLAKIIFYIINGITCISFVALIVSIGAMVEAWAIVKTPLVVALICSAWLIGYDLFMNYLERK